MALFNLLVKNLQGQSRCLSVSTPWIEAREAHALVQEAEGITPNLTRLVTGTRQLKEGDLLEVDEHGLFPSCTLVGTLLGGKGGFGSLLRGSQSQKKTTNFDACRDMNGRRLRHVISEKKLVEWQEQAKERELEKKALERMKKEERELKAKLEKDIALAHLREQTEDIMDKVADAVKDATKSRAEGKRKVEEPEPVVHPKRLRMLATFDEDEEDSEDEGVDLRQDSEAGPPGSNANGGVSSNPPAHELLGEEGRSEQDGQEGSPEALVENLQRAPDAPTGAEAEQAQHTASAALMVRSDQAGVSAEAEKVYVRPLDLGQFSSAQEMEGLGLDRLKEELQERGLKCGGSLSDRAARLFLLKSTPLEKLDKKLFAKPAPGKKDK